jgi:hypothetical protein
MANSDLSVRLVGCYFIGEMIIKSLASHSPGLKNGYLVNNHYLAWLKKAVIRKANCNAYSINIYQSHLFLLFMKK